KPETTDESLVKDFGQSQFSAFSLALLMTIIEDLNVYILYSKTGIIKIGIFDIIKNPKQNRENQTLLSDVFEVSFIGVNIRRIIADFFAKEDLIHNPGFIIDFLSVGERKIIEQIRENKFNEISIQFDNEKEATHIRIKKSGIDEEALYKVARFLRKRKY